MSSADNNKHNIRFFYNGLKVGKSPLYRCQIVWLSGTFAPGFRVSRWETEAFPDAFPKEVREKFEVVYEPLVDCEGFIVPVDHPLFRAVAEAWLPGEARQLERAQRRRLFWTDDTAEVRAFLDGRLDKNSSYALRTSFSECCV